jgi:hypothetical protein
MGHNGPLYQGVDKASFGYRFLSTLGWKEGQGLVRFPRLMAKSAQPSPSSTSAPAVLSIARSSL